MANGPAKHVVMSMNTKNNQDMTAQIPNKDYYLKEKPVSTQTEVSDEQVETTPEQRIITIDSADVEYGLDKAVVSIQEVIDMLEDAKSFGATHVVGLSGNYRGAQYVRPATDYEFLDNDE